MLIERRPDSFYFVVTATTRPPRSDEKHGIDYLFVSFDEFARMIEADELLEYAIVYNDYKGIPKQQIRDALASGRDVVLRVDVQGASTVRRLVPNAVSVFLTVVSSTSTVSSGEEVGGEDAIGKSSHAVRAKDRHRSSGP